METKEILISKITCPQNIRTDTSKDVSELMRSIKQHGLLEPIGVWKVKDNQFYIKFGNRRLEACRKLGYKKIRAEITDDPMTDSEFLIVNATENLHREDITPVELGRICSMLIEDGLTIDEVSARLSLTTRKIEHAMAIFKGVPTDFKDDVGYSKSERKSKGKIPSKVAHFIVTRHLPAKQKKDLFRIAKDKQLTGQQVEVIDKITRSTNATIDEAYVASQQYVNISIKITMHREKFEKCKAKSGIKTTTKLIKAILNNEAKGKKDMVV